MDVDKKFVVEFKELKLFNFHLDELFELQVNYKNVKYEFLIRFASQNKNMICFGYGAINRKHFSPPLYNRHSWQGEFEESVIYYDPTLYNNNEITLGWGIGKIEEWYLLFISHIIRILSTINKVKPENMLFFGSSGGGFTSVILSTMFKNSSAIVNNPQMFVLNYYQGHIENMLKACFDNQDLETVASEYSYRLNVIEMFKRKGTIPNITYLVNTMSEDDINDQLIPFINGLKSIEYFDDQLNVLFYKEPNGHAGVLDKEKTIKLIKNHFRYQENDLID